MQEVLRLDHGEVSRRDFPEPEDFVMDKVKWGRYDQLLTPAYWAVQSWLDESIGTYKRHRLGRSLKEEIGACVLGGYGIPAEVGNSAFEHLRSSGIFDGSAPSFETIFTVLSEPLPFGERTIRYRFPKQKSLVLSKVLELVDPLVPTRDAIVLRNRLLEIKGIGPKTASWITRNWLGSDQVAIIDLHIYRAGLFIGLFDRTETAARSYFNLEERFLDFADRIEVKPSILDTLMWCQMKSLGQIAHAIIKS